MLTLTKTERMPRTSLQITCGYERCKKDNRNGRDRELRAFIRSHYGILCAICGGTRNLEIDHKYGYGKEHRIQIGINPLNSEGFYYWLQRNNYPSGYTANGVHCPDGFRVLCKRCNNRQPRKGRTKCDYHEINHWNRKKRLT